MVRRVLVALVGSALVASGCSATPDPAASTRTLAALSELVGGDPGPLPSGERDVAAELAPASAREVASQADAGGAVESPGKDPKARRVAEDVSMRSEGSETWKLSSGLRQTEVFMEPKWFRDGDGAWQRVDPRVVSDPKQAGVVRSTGAGWSATFEVAERGVGLSFEGRDLRLTVRGSNLAAVPEVDERDDTVVWYRQVWPGVDLRYRVTPVGLKEDFIVASPEGFAAAGNFAVGLESVLRLSSPRRVHHEMNQAWLGSR